MTTSFPLKTFHSPETALKWYSLNKEGYNYY